MIHLGITTPFLFFTGKGGVGKTTVASSTALALAETGQRVLIVSTDPASNLDDVFDMRIIPWRAQQLIGADALLALSDHNPQVA